MQSVSNLDNESIIDPLKSKCDACLGLCCVALFFSKTDGFPHDKKAGEPCKHLAIDHTCKVYPNLKQLGYKGCISFECFGAGQKISRFTFEHQDWRSKPEISKNMFESFQVMRQLHEMIQYVAEANQRIETISIHDRLSEALSKLIDNSNLSFEELTELNLDVLHNEVDTLLTEASKLILGDENKLTKNIRKLGRSMNLIGKDLRQIELRNTNLRSALMIASTLQGVDFGSSNFLGADIRDALIQDADLSQCLFLTQAQVNSAKGNSSTKLPITCIQPKHWDE